MSYFMYGDQAFLAQDQSNVPSSTVSVQPSNDPLTFSPSYYGATPSSSIVVAPPQWNPQYQLPQQQQQQLQPSMPYTTTTAAGYSDNSMLQVSQQSVVPYGYGQGQIQLMQPQQYGSPSAFVNFSSSSSSSSSTAPVNTVVVQEDIEVKHQGYPVFTPLAQMSQPVQERYAKARYFIRMRKNEMQQLLGKSLGAEMFDKIKNQNLQNFARGINNQIVLMPLRVAAYWSNDPTFAKENPDGIVSLYSQDHNCIRGLALSVTPSLAVDYDGHPCADNERANWHKPVYLSDVERDTQLKCGNQQVQEFREIRRCVENFVNAVQKGIETLKDKKDNASIGKAEQLNSNLINFVGGISSGNGGYIRQIIQILLDTAGTERNGSSANKVTNNTTTFKRLKPFAEKLSQSFQKCSNQGSEWLINCAIASAKLPDSLAKSIVELGPTQKQASASNLISQFGFLGGQQQLSSNNSQPQPQYAVYSYNQ